MFNESLLKKELPDMESEVLDFWKKNDIFKKSCEIRKDRKPFVFFEGPPTANGLPGVHHFFTRTIKDIFCRYKTMQGFYVGRKAGWDTHGLPVELEIEKKLNLSSKSDIEEYGVLEFNKQCKDSVMQYESAWRELTDRMGYWLDMDDPYVTFTNDYIESVWWIIKQFYDKKLIYKGRKTVPYCARCGTPLSSHEVAQGYKEVKDPSLFVKFKAINKDFSFLVWTTTPWTLPANVALAVHPEHNYLLLKSGEEKFIIAEALANKVIIEEFRIEDKFKGSELLDIEYEPLLDFGLLPEDEKKKGYKVVGADFVTLDDGTGIVHIAPAFGEDDCKIGMEKDLPFLQPVDLEGKFVEGVGDWAGLFVKVADPKIIKHLKETEKLYKSEMYEHTYPFCWRCNTPLLYYVKASWYIKTTAFKEDLLKANNEINWSPDHIKAGRFGNWLENNIDWAISRERYWGTPLAIWQCICGEEICVGSRKDLQAFTEENIAELDLHKPYIDEITVNCPKCKEAMTRTEEVLDAWFDSGSMPLAQWGYPHKNRELFESNFPADFISEGIDQTRGWFYSLLAISTFLFKQSPFKNCLVLGIIQDKKGQKMSKSKGNAVDAWETIKTHGADSLRWYLSKTNNPWDNIRFNEADVKDIHWRFFVTIKNILSFFTLYANIDDLKKEMLGDLSKFEPKEVADVWIISKYNSLVKETIMQMEKYDITRTARAIDTFIDILSNWYIRTNRRRYWVSEMPENKLDAYKTLFICLDGLSKILAPFTPFWAEMVYKTLHGADETVHLQEYPKFDENLVNPKIEKEMDFIKDVVYLGRSIRNKTALKVRQPLSELYVIRAKEETFNPEQVLKEYKSILVDELNIKKVCHGQEKEGFVTYKHKLDFKQAGPKFGASVKKLSPLVEKLTDEESSKLFTMGTLNIEFEGTTFELEQNQVMRNVEGLSDYAAAEEGGLTVLLQTKLNKELISEGLAREVVNKVQFLRKESGFDVMDRIKIFYASDDEVAASIKKHLEHISKETLALEITREVEANEEMKEIKLNKLKAMIRLEKVVSGKL
ncbi:MAG: isoleucine--tRNA ligase [Pseudomonadota bacterium]